MRNCASGNLEIPGSVLADRPGMTVFSKGSAIQTTPKSARFG
jgi:hypothetical protein